MVANKKRMYRNEGFGTRGILLEHPFGSRNSRCERGRKSIPIKEKSNKPAHKDGKTNLFTTQIWGKTRRGRGYARAVLLLMTCWGNPGQTVRDR